jgi:tripartite-type tricarboxylate transporter receptor subunit TctC
MVPKATPEAILGRLEKACAAAAKEPAFAQAMKVQGTDVRYLDRKAYAAFLKKNDALNKDISKDLGLLKR